MFLCRRRPSLFQGDERLSERIRVTRADTHSCPTEILTVFKRGSEQPRQATRWPGTMRLPGTQRQRSETTRDAEGWLRKTPGIFLKSLS